MDDESFVESIARACRDLETDMWARLHRHADVADLKVVIRRAMEDYGRKRAAHG